MRVKILTAVLLVVCGIGIGWLAYENLMWAVWGKQNHWFEYVGFWGCQIMFVSGLIALKSLRFGTIRLRRFCVDAFLSWPSAGKCLPLLDHGKAGIASATNCDVDVDSRNSNTHVAKIDLERQTIRSTRIESFDTNMTRISSIYIDPNTCTCSQACVYECPEVLEVATGDGVPRVREGAERYFESHAEQIISAADVCPVEAITLKLEGE